ncbi:hypothetical protein B0H13DRAFT_1054673 [Mycena leptocephala]|nr:hypothetical protein B0H13DRAFT_1054673 [Mycena leptocephala]
MAFCTASRLARVSIRHIPSRDTTTQLGRPTALIFKPVSLRHRPHRQRARRRAPSSKLSHSDYLIAIHAVPGIRLQRSGVPLPQRSQAAPKTHLHWFRTRAPRPRRTTPPSHPSVCCPAHRRISSSPNAVPFRVQLNRTHCGIIDADSTLRCSTTIAPPRLPRSMACTHRTAYHDLHVGDGEYAAVAHCAARRESPASSSAHPIHVAPLIHALLCHPARRSATRPARARVHPAFRSAMPMRAAAVA